MPLVFTLSSDELIFLNRKTKTQNNVSRLGFAILLKCYQYLGRPIRVNEVNTCVKKYISKQLEIDTGIDLSSYSKSTFKNHKNAIRNYLDINLDKQKRRQIMKYAALDAATTKENLADIINRIIEEVFHQRYELPGYQALVRLSRAARTVTNQKSCKKISDSLSQDQKQFINNILEISDENAQKEWAWFEIKQEPKSPTSNNMRSFILYVQR